MKYYRQLALTVLLLLIAVFSAFGRASAQTAPLITIVGPSGTSLPSNTNVSALGCSGSNGVVQLTSGQPCEISFVASDGGGAYSVSGSGAVFVSCVVGQNDCTTNGNIMPPISGTCKGTGLTSGCPGATGQSLSLQAIAGNQTLNFFATLNPSTYAGTVTGYAPGWNLVGGPANTTLNGPIGALYTLQANDNSYEVLSVTTPLGGPQGYWAYFPSQTTVTLPATKSQTLTVNLPASHYVMVGNPFSVPASLSGASVAYAYDPSAGYVRTNSLQPGQGAWVFSSGGGPLMLTPA